MKASIIPFFLDMLKMLLLDGMIPEKEAGSGGWKIFDHSIHPNKLFRASFIN